MHAPFALTALFAWALAVVLMWPLGAKADQQDMSVLLLNHICHDTDARSQSACSGFLTGLLAGLQMGTQMSREGKPVCVPNTVTPDKLIFMLDKIVNDKPEFAAMPGLEAIAIGLQSVFPCRPQQTPPPKNRTPQ
jgi:Rap1a immunity proteins